MSPEREGHAFSSHGGDARLRVLAIIPARGGSKRLPRKNLLPLAGKPLIAHSIEHAKRAQLVERVVVSTEDAEISAVSEAYGAEVIIRPPELAGDTASSELALLHVLHELKEREAYSPDLVVFLQCTSPVREPEDIDNAIRTLIEEKADSLFSGCRAHVWLWRKEDHGVRSVTFDYTTRPRSQEFALEYKENGSIFVFKPWVLRERRNRLGGKIGVYEMSYWSGFEVDVREDFEVCEWILQRKAPRRRGALPEKVRAVVFDFDGVFTDNRVLVDQDGNEAVWCHRGDGWGLARLRERDVKIAVLSTEKNPVVAARCGKLGIEWWQGVDDKYATLAQILERLGIRPEDVVYVGNDLNDVECLEWVGCGLAPADAHPSVLAKAAIVLKSGGGHGAVREVCDLILEHLAAR